MVSKVQVNVIGLIMIAYPAFMNVIFTANTCTCIKVRKVPNIYITYCNVQISGLRHRFPTPQSDFSIVTISVPKREFSSKLTKKHYSEVNKCIKCQFQINQNIIKPWPNLTCKTLTSVGRTAQVLNARGVRSQVWARSKAILFWQTPWISR